MLTCTAIMEAQKNETLLKRITHKTICFSSINMHKQRKYTVK